MEKFRLIENETENVIALFDASDEDDAWAQLLNSSDYNEMVQELLDGVNLKYQAKYGKKPDLACFTRNVSGKVTNLEKCIIHLNVAYQMIEGEESDHDESDDEELEDEFEDF